jgi:diguanylate cyclase (GGDEF)-like protein/PAS domain S-box-containing protein
MKKTSIRDDTEPIFSFSNFLITLKSPYFLTGILIALAIWFIDPFIDAVFLQKDSYIELLTKPNIFEVHTRTKFSIIIIFICFIFSHLLTHSRKVEGKLRQSDKKYQLLVETMREGLAITDKNEKLSYVNKSLCEIVGLPREKLIGQDVTSFVDEKNIKILQDRLKERKDGVHKPYEIVWTIPNGKKIDSLVIPAPLLDDKGDVIGSFATITDISVRKNAEAALKRTHRALQVLSQCNQALIHAEEEIILVKEICRIIVEEGNYMMAWVGYAEQDEYKTVRPVAMHGHEQSYLDEIQPLSWDENNDRGMGPNAYAIRERKTHIVQNLQTDHDFIPWKQLAAKRGYGSIVAMPLLHGKKTLGALMIYAHEYNAFDNDEVHFLEKLSDNLAFGINSLRNESDRMRAEEELFNTANLLQNVINTSPDLIFIKDLQLRTILCNNAFAKAAGKNKPEDLYGLKDIEIGWDAELVKGNPEKDIRGFENDDRAALEGKHIRAIAEPVNVNNTIRYFDTLKSPFLDAKGNIIGVLGIGRDVTQRKESEISLQESQRQLATLISNLHGTVYRCNNDPDWTMQFISDGCMPLTGYKPEELVAQRTISYSELIHPEDTQMVWDSVQEAIKKKQPFQLIYRISTRNGELKWVHEHGLGIFDKNNNLIALEGFIEDITERKQAEKKLQEINKRFKTSFTNAAIGMALVSPDHSIIETNQTFCNMLGYTEEELTGTFFKDITHPEDVEISLEQHRKLIAGEIDKYHFEKRYLHKQGHQVWGMLSVSLVRDEDNASPLYAIAQIQDITDRKQADKQLSYQATHDALTGLVNRREFERRTEQLLSSIKQNNDEHALCFMDLDQFKIVNDTCGHAAGDELLRQLGSALINIVRHRDTLARLGGDEFGILIEHCSLDDAQRVATSLLKAVQNYQFLWEEHNFKIGVSIGLVAIKDTTSNLTELFKDADAACYMAKSMGRNRIHVYHEGDEKIAQHHGEMQWVTRINQALEEDRFYLYAQSIESLANNTEDKHYELLLRMKDEQGKIIPPGAFLPAAERYNLITKLDSWVIKKTFLLLAENPAFLKQTQFISINLSGQSLTDSNIFDFIVSELEQSSIEGNKICFEITETAAISNLNTATKFISRLKNLGCQFALDDFGSGLSSFGYLKNLPVDYLKIDGMFVKDIVQDPIDHAMVKSINDIGHVMNMKTIAEFVENDEIKGMLREIGVNYAQGFGIGKPQPFIELLS